ncbi:MAG: peptide/nickel transport system permease protein [Solirubrobacteraceae bacterium]|nr:peptide/nickel transport system permease protein [Solirubrobacteraceae bacterium]
MSASSGALRSSLNIGARRSQRLAQAMRRWPVSVRVAAGVLGVLVVLALLANAIVPLDDTAVDLDRVLDGPSAAHLMGTDEVGRDLFARVLHGFRISLTIAVLAALAAVTVGTLVGVLAGTMGGKVDALVMRVTDVFASQNHFLFGILLLVLFRPALGGAGAVMLAVGLTHWPSLARIVRGELMSLRERPFVSAAIGGGASRWRLARRHYLPHLMPAVGLAFVLTVPHAVFHESAYSFLGLGLPAHEASLGNILADGQRSLLAGGWWIALFPGLAILTAAMTAGTLAEYWREHLHPRWRSELEL